MDQKIPKLVWGCRDVIIMYSNMCLNGKMCAHEDFFFVFSKKAEAEVCIVSTKTVFFFYPRFMCNYK